MLETEGVDAERIVFTYEDYFLECPRVRRGKKRRKVRECLMKFKLDLIVLQEAKKEMMQDRLVRSGTGPLLSKWVALPAIGTSGGILLAWKPEAIKKIDVWMGSISIFLKSEDSSSGVEWVFIGIHGPSMAKNKDALWVELGDIRNAWAGPWLIG